MSHHEHNFKQCIPKIVELARQGKSIAVVSDAGTPAIADPGSELVASCAAAGIPVCPIPGPCSPVIALSISGFDCSEFSFYGFVPAKGSVRRVL